MKRVKSKLSMVVIAVAAIVLFAGFGASAYWAVTQILAGNQITSGHMSISVYDMGTPGVITPLDVDGIMPGGSGNRIFEVESAAGNPLTDLYFGVPTVIGNGTLKDNVMVAFCLMTDPYTYYWLEPAGAVAFAAGSENTDNTYVNHGSIMSAYAEKSWGDLPGYSDLPAGEIRHVKVYYYLPVDCSEDCHDSDVTFDMSFELLQSH